MSAAAVRKEMAGSGGEISQLNPLERAKREADPAPPPSGAISR
jgi:hypothetical protein